MRVGAGGKQSAAVPLKRCGDAVRGCGGGGGRRRRGGVAAEETLDGGLRGEPEDAGEERARDGLAVGLPGGELQGRAGARWNGGRCWLGRTSWGAAERQTDVQDEKGRSAGRNKRAPPQPALRTWPWAWAAEAALVAAPGCEHVERDERGTEETSPQRRRADGLRARARSFEAPLSPGVSRTGGAALTLWRSRCFSSAAIPAALLAAAADAAAAAVFSAISGARSAAHSRAADGEGRVRSEGQWALHGRRRRCSSEPWRRALLRWRLSSARTDCGGDVTPRCVREAFESASGPFS